MPRAYNFSAGPAAIPEPVLLEIQRDLLNYKGSGTSLMEISHRSLNFVTIAERAEAALRRLLRIGEEYFVLFLQGGASLQFAMVPLNLSQAGDTVEYLNTGAWSTKAIAEAERMRTVHVVASSSTDVPEVDSWSRADDAQYFHITSNETISGVQFDKYPTDVGVPLVADMTSDFLTRPVNIGDFGLVYAGAQKNAGLAGMTMVIVRKDLCRIAGKDESHYLNYRIHGQSGSMYNTPNTFAWYVSGLVFEWLINEGGIDEMERRCQKKSRLLYDVIDQSDLYESAVVPSYRSKVNVIFDIANESLADEFTRRAAAANIINIRGHRSVGGFRASLYNGVSIEAVHALVEHMKSFEKEFA